MHQQSHDELRSLHALLEAGHLDEALSSARTLRRTYPQNTFVLALEKQIERSATSLEAGHLPVHDTGLLKTAAELIAHAEKSLRGHDDPPSFTEAPGSRSTQQDMADRHAALQRVRAQYFHHADLHMRGGDYTSALAEIRRALILDPRDSFAREYQGKLEELLRLQEACRSAKQPAGEQSVKNAGLESRETCLPAGEPSSPAPVARTAGSDAGSTEPPAETPNPDEIIRMLTLDIEELAARASERPTVFEEADQLLRAGTPTDTTGVSPEKDGHRSFTAELVATALFILLAIAISYYLFSSKQPAEKSSPTMEHQTTPQSGERRSGPDVPESHAALDGPVAQPRTPSAGDHPKTGPSQTPQNNGAGNGDTENLQ